MLEQKGGWRRNHLQEEPAGKSQAQASGEETYGFAPAQQWLCHGEQCRIRPAANFAFTRGTCPGREAVTPRGEPTG